MSTSTNLQSKTALITGGSKGIGLGIAEAMARQHMKVAITSRHFDEAQAAAKHLISLGAESALAIECDVRDYDAQQNAVKEVLADWGQLDVVIANAGVGYFAPIDKMSQEQWHEIIDINLTGAFYTLQASVDALKASKGYFITLASLAGTNFFANGAAYNASKFGLVGFTQAAMLDLRPYGIKVSTIMPGSVATHFNGHVPDDKDGWKIQPEDIGQIVIAVSYTHLTLPTNREV